MLYTTDAMRDIHVPNYFLVFNCVLKYFSNRMKYNEFTLYLIDKYKPISIRNVNEYLNTQTHLFLLGSFYPTYN